MNGLTWRKKIMNPTPWIVFSPTYLSYIMNISISKQLILFATKMKNNLLIANIGFQRNVSSDVLHYMETRNSIV